MKLVGKNASKPSGKNYTAPGPHTPLMDNTSPSKAGVVENTPEFKKAASDVWDAAGRGRNTDEAGSSLDSNLKSTPVKTSNTDGKMRMQVPVDSYATIHSHPNHFNGGVAGGQPSDTDINTAKKLGKTVYVVSKNGLQAVDKFGKGHQRLQQLRLDGKGQQMSTIGQIRTPEGDRPEPTHFYSPELKKVYEIGSHEHVKAVLRDLANKTLVVPKERK